MILVIWKEAVFYFLFLIRMCNNPYVCEHTIPGRGYGILPSYSTHLWSGPSLWANGPLNAALMSAMLYTHTAEPRKMELKEKVQYKTL